jgi:hypothetical protein
MTAAIAAAVTTAAGIVTADFSLIGTHLKDRTSVRFFYVRLFLSLFLSPR